MLLLLGAIAIGVALGLVLRGSFRNLGQLRLRLWPLALLGLALQVVPLGSGTEQVNWLGAALLTASFVLLFVVLIANIRVNGVPLLMVGIALNAVAIAVNGGMPVSDGALRSAIDRRAEYREARTELVRQGPPKHHLADDDTLLRPLTDVIGIGSPVRQVYSVGDLIALAGIVWILAAAMRGSTERQERGERAPLRPRRPGRPTRRPSEGQGQPT